MAGDEVEVTARLRRRLEEEYGMREAAYLMDRPSGGWDALATKEQLAAFQQRVDLRFEALDDRFDALEHRLRAEFRDQTTRLLKWIVPTIFAGIAALGGIVGAVGGILAAR
jgi:hypothetical protein